MHSKAVADGGDEAPAARQLLCRMASGRAREGCSRTGKFGAHRPEGYLQQSAKSSGAQRNLEAPTAALPLVIPQGLLDGARQLAAAAAAGSISQHWLQSACEDNAILQQPAMRARSKPLR